MHGGLGFNFKWDLGFMHDTLDYFSLDPVFRKYHHDKLTFNQMYAYSGILFCRCRTMKWFMAKAP